MTSHRNYVCRQYHSVNSPLIFIMCNEILTFQKSFLGSNSGGTLGRQANSPYRTPAPPVSPPSVPSNYAPSYIAMQRQISQQQATAMAAGQHGNHGTMTTADRKSGYAPVGNVQVAQVKSGLIVIQS